jgi:uncharacterized membrane protein
MNACFYIGDMRYFEEDPRFGLITLSENCQQALSPAVNDPGTAIQIISSHIKIVSLYNNSQEEKNFKKKYVHE